MFRLLPAVAALLASACAAVPASQGPLVGFYGGQHIRMEVGASGSAIEYDCAAGTLAGPLPARGAFTASGTHTPGMGGPERVGEVRPAYPAAYGGRVAGDEIEMVVDAALPSGPTRMGPFRLKRGSDGVLMRCL